VANFIAALWTCNTSHDPQHTKKAVWVKLADMTKALTECQRQVNVNAARLSPDNEFQAIFAAPEYFFTGPGDSRKPMTEAEKVTLEHGLLNLSKKHPKILIVPGSIYYAKPLVRPANANKLDRAAGRIVQTPAQKDRRTKMTNVLTTVGLRELNRGGATEADLGGYLVYKDGGANVGPTGYTVPSVMDKQDAIAGKNPQVIRNTTYLYLNGTRHGKYDKQSDYHESLWAPDEMVFVPGTKDECPDVGKHRFGVEICLDHAMSRLKKRNPAGLDFHLVVSDHVNNSQAAMAMAPFGYFLHASSNTNETKVIYRNDAGTLIDLTEDNGYWFEMKAQGTGRLDSWLLPLPDGLRTAEAARKAAARTQATGMQRARGRGNP
jgi:predicted amidohydrolase